MSIMNKLKEWRETRLLTKPSGSFDKFIEEELQEYREAKTEHDRIDAIGDIVIFGLNELELEGYNALKVLNEIIKEINSREGTLCPDTGKWLKTTTEYKANFSNCKLKDESK